MSNDIPALPCYLNGEYSNVLEAKVSVLDRGFIFGDGVYEVVPAYNGRPFRFEQHMARLDRSLGEMRIRNPLDRAGWRQIVDNLVAAYAKHVGKDPKDTNQLVYLQVTRGVAWRDHVMPPDIEPTVFGMVNRLYIYTPEERAKGVMCVTADDFRWKKAHIKSTSLAGAVLSRQISADVGGNETIMFRDGWLSEAAASNVWVVKNGIVYGPPKDNLVLEGIRYGLLEELCQRAGVKFELKRVSRDEVMAADEIILSSATKEILACTVLDGKPVANGKPGPIYEKLFAGYQQAKQSS